MESNGFVLNVYTKDLYDLSRADTASDNGDKTCDVGDGNVPLSCDMATGKKVSNSSPFVRYVLNLFQPTKYLIQYFPLFWQKAIISASTVLLFFTTSTLVSFTLKETQERMLRFTYMLQYYTRHNLSVIKLVVTHLVESLVFVPIMVGIMGFLYEFFADSLLTFLLLSITWIMECYAVVR